MTTANQLVFPITDTCLYEVVFLDGLTETLSIAKNLLLQVNQEGHRQLLLDEIINHRTNDTALSRAEGMYTTSTGTIKWKRTTKGWEL